MKWWVSLSLVMLSGCASAMVEHDAKTSCAKQGKKAFMFDAHQSGIPLLFESASVMVLCVGPDEVTHMPSVFGADAVSASNIQGAGIISVSADAVAARAGLKPNDIVYEVAGHAVTSAADLRTEIDSHAPGDQAAVKVRRGGQPDVVLTAHF